MWEPSDVRRPRGQNRGIPTCYGTEEVREGLNKVAGGVRGGSYQGRGVGIADTLNNLTIETAGTDEDVAEQLTAALEMEVEEEV